MSVCKISVAIPTYKRQELLLQTLERIMSCDPAPEEIIVHVDGGDETTGEAVAGAFPQVNVIKSDVRVGPGGGRNKILARAANSIVASFDDDSYPIDKDYFKRLLLVFAAFPEAAVIDSNIFIKGECVEPDTRTAQWVSGFTGCGCAYRRDVFNETSGYVSLPVAYGMEEVDLAIRLHANGWRILKSSWLRVMHDTSLEHHNSPKITSGSIANQALLMFLRYPLTCWWIGLAQVANRILWLIKNKRTKGIIKGVCLIPVIIWRHKKHRRIVAPIFLRSYLRLRRQPVEAPPF
ncbi:MAG: glycosyltransferase family 2 protein [Acidobacteria bacterium]|nr:glycosyltransferase family 2 protein [Acidobacteriota bacterium]